MTYQPNVDLDRPLTDAELARLTEQRRILTKNRLANHTSTGHNLLTTLDHPTIASTIDDLLAALAALVTMTDPHQSQDWQRTRSPSADPPVPNFQPAWAATKLEQVDRQLYELAGNIHGWTNRPTDPQRLEQCPDCGRKYGVDDNHCRWCGHHIRPLREATRRCDHCGTAYIAMAKHSRYCSQKCRVAAHRTKPVTDVTEHGTASG